MELICNCAHFSPNYTFIGTDQEKRPNKIIKASFVSTGIDLIKNEFNGLKWYANQQSIDPISVATMYIHENRCATLILPFHAGTCGNPHLPIQKNYQKLINAISYYTKIFKKTDYQFRHGDYSIENILFDGDEIQWLIDWEHFNKVLPQEFDLLNCIMEICYFNFMKSNNLSKDDIRLLRKLLILISDEIRLPENCFERPAEYFRNLCLSNSNFFGTQAIKYPFVTCCLTDIEKMDYLFQKY